MGRLCLKLQSSKVRTFKVELWTLGPFELWASRHGYWVGKAQSFKVPKFESSGSNLGPFGLLEPWASRGGSWGVWPKAPKAHSSKIKSRTLGLLEPCASRGGSWGGAKLQRPTVRTFKVELWDFRTLGLSGWAWGGGPNIGPKVLNIKVHLWDFGTFELCALRGEPWGRLCLKLQSSKVRKFWVKLRTFWTSRTLGLSGRVLRVGPKTPKAHSSKIQAQHWPQSSDFQGPTFGLWDFRTLCPSG